MNNQQIKADAGKLRISLVPTGIIRAIARVREYGVSKYGARESWREVERERYVDALLRHTLAWMDDPDGVDAESGLPHLWHMACNMAFLIEIDQWVAEHPLKTYKQDFTEKFPNMDPLFNIFSSTKPCALYCFSRDGKLCRDYDDCAVCWNQPMEESHD